MNRGAAFIQFLAGEAKFWKVRVGSRFFEIGEIRSGVGGVNFSSGYLTAVVAEFTRRFKICMTGYVFRSDEMRRKGIEVLSVMLRTIRLERSGY